ncbi:hypothetical protein KR038_001868, partial [Drosophila bunnanda]
LPPAELRSWLLEKSKPYAARVEFAIRVWQSVEFPYPDKYDIIVRWLGESLPKCKKEPLPMQQLKDLFALRGQPRLVGQESKSLLIRALLSLVSRDEEANVAVLELLPSLLDCELLQDALRADYELLCECYASLFRCHQQCVEQKKQLTTSSHVEFIVPVIKQLAQIALRSQKLPELRECYNARTVRPLVELLLTLESDSLVEELAELEKQLKNTYKENRNTSQPLHVTLLLLEAAVFNNRYEPLHLGGIVRAVFSKNETSLPLAAYLLMSLRKYDISLQFNVNRQRKKNQSKADCEESKELEEAENTEIKVKALSAFDFIAENLLQLARQHSKSNLKELLVLLCSALRLNPLLLDQSVYQITVWLLTAHKETAEEERLYSEYLVLLLDMFRRLSRAERFVLNLLKSLKEWLSVYQLPNPIHGEAKKRRIEGSESVKAKDADGHDYLRQIFAGASSAVAATAPSSNDAFKQLAQTWPSHSAGVAFTRLVSHLMTKPSLVIWRTLLHSFVELLQEEQQQTLPGNLDFARELHAALLCQYLSGTRLAEQLHLHQTEIEQQLQHTAQVLEQFGRRLLSQEHNRRLMNAFLECTERASGLELLLAYYWPDGHTARQRKLQLRRFLPPAEWTLIQQRVHNFGKSSCRQRLQRLELQLAESGWLLQEDQRNASCSDVLAETLGPQQLFRLTRSQKQLRLRIRADQDWEEDNLEDAECVELLTLQLIGKYAKTAKKAKGSLLSKISLEEKEQLEEAVLIGFIKDKTQRQLQLPCARLLVESLQRLPLAQLPCSIRFRLWLVIFALYRDLSCSDQEQEVVQWVLELLIDLMHFGLPLPICSYFGQLSDLLEIIPTTSAASWSFYETLFARCIRRQSAGYEPFLASCTEYLRTELAANGKLQAEQCRLLLLAIETLSSVTGVQGRKMQRQLQPLVEIYGNMVSHKFRSKKRKEAAVYKEFVDDTLAGYATYVSSCINSLARQERANEQGDKKHMVAEEEPPAGKRNKETKAEKEQDQQAIATVQPIDDNFRRICKIYIGHSLNYRNAHAIRLLNVALAHRQVLHLDPDEIEFVLSSYWRQLNADIEAGGDISCLECLEPAIRLIIGYKTNEDFLLILRHLSSQVEQMPRPETPVQHTVLRNVLTLLALFAKCSLSSVKAAVSRQTPIHLPETLCIPSLFQMLNEHFELISVSVALRLPEPKDAAYRDHALRLLEAQRNLAGNRTVSLTGETLDCLLGAMLDVDIKHLMGRATWQDFVDLYGAITENLLVLLKQHGNLMADRAAQLSALCQDLVQGIVGYRAERKQAQDLSETELDGLAELGLKLATVMATVAGTQALAVKRVAPFLLIFTIRQMVATERPTTLFEKVKVHIVSVCHELIGICDHRVGHFILRSSSEAGARLYEGLVKEHDKYHKFRGKV